MNSCTEGTIGRTAALPADWREKMLRALSGDGVSEPPHIELWRLNLINFAQVLGWASLMVAFITAPLCLSVLFPGIPEDTAVNILIAWWLVVTPLGVWLFIGPRLQAANRLFRSQRHGRNPSHAVQTAPRPPILYLRSFGFDSAASVTTSSFLYNASPEMLVTERMRPYGPVIAIGRPGEPRPPAGAMRFHVTDEHWEDVIKQILPCCQLVLWVTGNTMGLNWEIQQLIGNLSPQRLLLWPNMNLQRANHSHVNWKRTGKKRSLEWKAFVDAHSDLFPKPLPLDITKVRFIAFEQDWTPIPIPSARYPSRLLDRLSDTRGLMDGLPAFLKERLSTTGE
jgi:hypothetical protein